MKSFEELGLSKWMLKVLRAKGFELPTAIQEKVIPFLMGDKRDVIAQAQTGTGKTAAFGIPILEALDDKAKHVKAIVLAPTRELAIQVSEEIYSLRGEKNLRVAPIYGGQAMSQQLRRLKKGVDIVVGTPGRVIDHLNRGSLILDKVDYLVLDEADEMLNMGFIEDVAKIMESTNDEKRTLLFSATMPNQIQRIAKKYMNDYELIKAANENLTVNTIDQIYFEVSASDKFEALCRIIDVEEDFYGLVFCRTKVDTDTISKHLVERGYDSEALNGDVAQATRERILGRFKKKTINILVATDVAARGIDVNDLTHVINFSLPQDPESYVHRIGRTGRAGKEGNAITFVTPSEYKKLQFIKRIVKTDIRKGKVPKVKDIIAIKRTRMITNIEEIIKAEPSKECYAMSEELLKNSPPEDIIAAMVKYVFEGELSEESYARIKDFKDTKVDVKGKTRLFIGQGRLEGMTSKKLVTLIEKKCRVSQRVIKDVKVLDKFSFVTLPFHEAEEVLSYFKKRKNRDSLYVTKAKKS
ncbi:DEAD/DEAH box helicase [Candidatus Omnitrophota bacterium]